MKKEKNDYLFIGSYEEIEGKEVYLFESTEQGQVFKDEYRFLNEPNKVCYISEYGLFNELHGNEYFEFEGQYYSTVDTSFSYTRNDFLRIAKETTNYKTQEEIEHHATLLFEMVDWQSVESLADELENSEDF